MNDRKPGPTGLKATRRARPDGGCAIGRRGLIVGPGRRVAIMGILNTTPDSFYDGGRFTGVEAAVRRAVEMAGEGADIIDIGGESTRPGAADIPVEDELSRVIPVIEAVARAVSVPISVDTRKAEVAEAAIKAGAAVVNDVSALRHDPEMARVVAEGKAVAILMHMRGSPADMQTKAGYVDVVGEVISELGSSIELAVSAGVDERSIIVDPGICFSKTAEQNLEILKRLPELGVLSRPVCVGVSRKSFIGAILGGAGPEERLCGTIAASAVSVMNGADILRAHDVKEAREAAAVARAISYMKAG